MTPEEALDALLSDLGLGPGRGAIGLGVSGGGDSAALLHVAALRAARDGTAFRVATVDHGLRPGSAEEARRVALACAGLGLPHETLRWEEGPGRGNLQERAREARRRLLGAWAARHGLAAVLLGHTADDQAETVLLRLARGSGVDGLAGMPRTFEAEGVSWGRPFLGLGRESLRDWLRQRGLPWVEDPSNDDPRFDRVRARAMMGALADLGLTRDRLLRTAGHMERARQALAARARALAGAEVRQEGSDLVLPLAFLSPGLGDDEAVGRVVAAALMWVGQGGRRPRWESLRRLAAVVAGGRAATLAGCRVTPEGPWARVAPEGRHPVPAREPGLRFDRLGAFG